MIGVICIGYMHIYIYIQNNDKKRQLTHRRHFKLVYASVYAL